MTNGRNSWGVPFSAISFLESVLDNHASVMSFTRTNDIQFIIAREFGRPNVNAVLIDEYVLGEAAAYAILKEFNDVTVIVNNGSWNRVALDWRDFAKRTGVAVFQLRDFMGALNAKDPTKYVTFEEREERDRKRNRSS